MKPSTWHLDPAADEQAALWAARLDGSVLSAADRAALDAWLSGNPVHRTMLSAYCQFSADLEQQLPLMEGIKAESAGIQPSLQTAQPRPWLRWPALAGVALSAAAAVALGFWLTAPPTQFENIASAVAQRQEVTLADGTRIQLNAQTSLVADLGRSERHVRLASGEAFFAVSKDKSRPFIVETPAGSVRVTGTHFDVRAESPSDLEVTVAEGSVLVRPGNMGGATPSPVSLGAGDRFSRGSRGTDVKRLSPAALEDALAWRQGQVVFTDVPLREALACFARYHGRGITATAAAADLHVGGRYSLDDLDGFFTALEQVLPVRVTRDLSGTVQVGLRNAP
jgi:transmembrane sensor